MSTSSILQAQIDVSPEQLLFQSVVIKALTDATAPDPSAAEDRRAKDSADKWLRGFGRDFREICGLAGFDAEFVHESYVAGRVNGDLLRAAEKKTVKA